MERKNGLTVAQEEDQAKSYGTARTDFGQIWQALPLPTYKKGLFYCFLALKAEMLKNNDTP